MNLQRSPDITATLREIAGSSSELRALVELMDGLLTELHRMLAAAPGGSAALPLAGCGAADTAASQRPGPRPDFGPEALTPHERRLIGMAVDGQTNSEIARQFGVTRRAVEFHFTQIYRKLGITRRPQLHRFACVYSSPESAQTT